MGGVPDVLTAVGRVCLLVWVVSTLLHMGLQLKVRQVLEPLRSALLVGSALFANFVLVPVLGYLILRILPLKEGFRVGLALTAVCAGAPFLPTLSDLSQGNRAWAAALMLLLTLGTIVYLPLVLPWWVADAKVDARAIEQSLVLMLLLPLVAGLCLRTYNESLAVRLTGPLGKISNVTLVATLVLVVVVSSPELWGAVGHYGILAAVILVLGGTTIGFALGGPRRDIRVVLGFATGARNVGAALTLATQNFGDDPDVKLMCVIITLVMAGVQLPLAKWLGRGARHDPAAPERRAP
jgi:BASS family bile acid:Na+ symporter